MIKAVAVNDDATRIANSDFHCIEYRDDDVLWEMINKATQMGQNINCNVLSRPANVLFAEPTDVAAALVENLETSGVPNLNVLEEGQRDQDSDFEGALGI